MGDDGRIETEGYEKLGRFYLGREVDDDGAVTDRPLLYDSRDLVTHGVVLGMTGSGKTGLCMALLEEAAIDGIPAIVLDPKGDIANLLLAFPELRPEDFRPWISEDDARRKDRTPEEHAAATAAAWREGLAGWGQSPDRIRRLREAADVCVFTPGSEAGIPVSILGSLSAPPEELLADREAIGERVESTAASLLSLVGVDADPTQSPEAVLLSTVLGHAWTRGQDLTLESLIRHLHKPPFDKVGVLDLESFLPARQRQALALRFNNLLASPGFAAWRQGPSLDVGAMLHTATGRPRVSIFSIAHLGDAERMFFVSLLLGEIVAWMRRQGGTTSLRAILYMDEVFGFLPPTASPPSKKPLLTLLKQARAFGLGTLLATQNPVDLDYKALSNAGTWFLGRLQTERDQKRVLDGLEGAGGRGGFDRAATERRLAGLDSRVFLLHSVHEDEPTLFHVRWVMSYLAGPLTRPQIRRLMDPRRDELLGGPPQVRTAAGQANPMLRGAVAASPASVHRPVVGDGVEERFVALAGQAEGVVYRPALLRRAAVQFRSKKAGVDAGRTVATVHPIESDGIDWENPLPAPRGDGALERHPSKGVPFAELPGYAMNASNYKAVRDEFAQAIYRDERLELLHSPLLRQYSQAGETEGDFRARLAQAAREARDEAVDKLRRKYERRIDTKQEQLARAEAAVEREKAEADAASWQAGASMLGGVLGGLFGRRSVGGMVSSGSRAYKQRSDVGRARARAGRVETALEELEAELREEIDALEDRYDPGAAELETLSIQPYKKDIDVELVALVWLPFDERGEAAW